MSLCCVIIMELNHLFNHLIQHCEKEIAAL